MMPNFPETYRMTSISVSIFVYDLQKKNAEHSMNSSKALAPGVNFDRKFGSNGHR